MEKQTRVNFARTLNDALASNLDGWPVWVISGNGVSCAAAHSGERLGRDENEASVIKARTSVVSIACDLFNKLAIGLEDLFRQCPRNGRVRQDLTAPRGSPCKELGAPHPTSRT